LFGLQFSFNFANMNDLLGILTSREWFLLIMASVTYVVLFIVAVQNSRRKILLLQERLNKVHVMKEEQLAHSQQNIEQNLQRIAQLETLIQKLGDENSMLRLELEEKKARLDYANTMAMIDHEKREQAETVIFGSDIYTRINALLAQGRSMTDADFNELGQVVNSVYANFTERLYSLYKLNTQEYRVSLLVKVHVQPKDIAMLTAHSKESVASTRSRLYQKVFGKKGSSKDWDDFILSL
jgi:regulator of replication initiation timing